MKVLEAPFVKYQKEFVGSSVRSWYRELFRSSVRDLGALSWTQLPNFWCSDHPELGLTLGAFIKLPATIP